MPDSNLPSKIAFVDIETTGGRLLWDRIIEIGILRVEDNKVVSSFETLINPSQHLPEEITLLTGISAPELENAPYFREVKDQIAEILEDCYFVAHNVRFDYGFLKQEFRRLNQNFSPKHFCTVKLSRYLYPKYKHHNLDSLIERFNFECPARHRAYSDAKVLFDFYQSIQKDLPIDTVVNAVNKALKKPSIPVKLTQKDLDALPEGPGVYIFYGESGMPLYIGKSVNIADRVLSHFSGDHSSSTEMKISQQIESIETIETAGELSALLKENILVKKMKPLYNRMLRREQKLVFLQKRLTKEGYLTLDFVNLTEVDLNDLSSILGVFRSVKAAKDFLISLSKEHTLCEKLLNIEHTNSACFGYRLGRCKGACSQKEKAANYNLRFIEAFLGQGFKSWPFEGPIIIEEINPITGDQIAILVDKWCLLGNLNSKDGEEVFDPKEAAFDLDTYKILVRFINNPKKKANIRKFNNSNLKSAFNLETVEEIQAIG